ncbi:MAG TPA: NAD(P)H:quinone oxidoreductase [Gammaproteobacteria bacterium]|nr:NAD(P)H:quinone oxidoreductase [Gammaproteobacteria bacterium]
MKQAHILVLYYSRGGRTAALARHAARGVESAGAIARLRTVPPVAATTTATLPPVPGDGPPYAELGDLVETDGLLLGSPTRFGNMAAPLKHFLDSTSELWLSGALVDKPAGVFTSSSSPHGGQESTLLSMQLPLLHHGMIIVGVPYTETALFDTRTGGSPYGASHLAAQWNAALSADEIEVAKALGARVARLAQSLAAAR